jgi:hypothetical protein
MLLYTGVKMFSLSMTLRFNTSLEKRMQHMDGLSCKAYAPNDIGVIPDISDDTWLPLIKEKVIASLVT